MVLKTGHFSAGGEFRQSERLSAKSLRLLIFFSRIADSKASTNEAQTLPLTPAVSF
jgi:hypothetical protein